MKQDSWMIILAETKVDNLSEINQSNYKMENDVGDQLIDNATLSGVQRLQGQSQTRNLYNIDNDICCFEKYISAIIFGDRILAVDDYKIDYRSARIKAFPNIEFLAPDALLYDEISRQAAEFASQTVFAFEGSRPVGQALAFFETIKINPQMRWNIFGSSEYLTLSYLVDDAKIAKHEGSVGAAFGNESGDHAKSASNVASLPSLFVNGETVQNVKDFIQRYAAENQNFAGSGSNDTLAKIVFGYGWVAERSYFYNALANEIGANCTLSPLRDAFCESNYRIDHRKDLNTIVQRLSENGKQAVASIVSNSGEAKFALRMPFFTAYLLSRCKNVIEAVELAYELRDDHNVKACKAIMSNLQHLEKLDRLKEVNSLLQFLEQELQYLLQKYSVSTEQRTPFGMSVGFSGIDFDVSKLLSKLFRNYRHKPFGKIFKSMATDMMMTERLGTLHDKAISLIHEHKDAGFTRPSLTPTYMARRTSEYGGPATPGRKV